MKSPQPLSALKISIVTVLAVTSFAAYDLFFIQNASAVDTSVPDATAALDIPGLTPEQRTLVERLENIHLDTAFFQDPLFLTLKSNEVTLTPEPAGKPNPFAPLNLSQAPAAVQTPAKTPAKKTTR